jgi:hypothetical protein
MEFVMTDHSQFPVLKPRSEFVFVGRNDRGGWIVRDRRGLRGGMFVDQSEARRFALAETGNCPEAIKTVQDVLPLTFD